MVSKDDINPCMQSDQKVYRFQYYSDRCYTIGHNLCKQVLNSDFRQIYNIRLLCRSSHIDIHV